MTRSGFRIIVLGLFVLLSVCGLLPSSMRAQAPPAAPSGFPMTITVSSGPRRTCFLT